LPNDCLLNSGPVTDSFSQFERDSTTSWNGISNAEAFAPHSSDEERRPRLDHHSGKENPIEGGLQVGADIYPDPIENNTKLGAVDMKFVPALSSPVILMEIKRESRF